MTSLKGKFTPVFSLEVMVLVVLSVFSPCPSHAFLDGKIKSFSADYVYLTPHGKVASTSKIYVTPDAMRIDGLIGRDKAQKMPKADISMLYFKDRHEAYMINNDKKIYAGMNFNSESMGIKDFKNAKVIKVLGKERVSGYDCVKKLVSTTFKIMGMTMTHKTTIWVSDRFDMPLRTKTERGDVMELRNIKPGTPDKMRFRLPAGYKKVDSVVTVMNIHMDHNGMGQQAAGSHAAKASQPPSADEIRNIQKALQNFQKQLKHQ